MPGTGQLTVTGQLGDVMKESAQAAHELRARPLRRSWAWRTTTSRSTTSTSTCRPAPSPRTALSAGVTMATAICSLVTGTPVNSDVAMTGEVTLTGQVLPIGGLKEKTLAAQRAGINTVILPARNEVDLEDVPEVSAQGHDVRPRRPRRAGVGGGHGPAHRHGAAGPEPRSRRSAGGRAAAKPAVPQTAPAAGEATRRPTPPAQARHAAAGKAPAPLGAAKKAHGGARAQRSLAPQAPMRRRDTRRTRDRGRRRRASSAGPPLPRA